MFMPASNLDLNLLTVFATVYRHKSITLAAEEMGMTQPGVSGLLKRLQTQLGTELFVRSGRGIAPTRNAQTLITQIEPALFQINNAVKGLEGFTTDIPHHFVIYTSEPVMLMLLPKIEQDRQLGEVSIELLPTHSDEERLVQDLNQRRGDLAIEFSAISNRSFFTEPLFDDQMCIIARNGHPRITNTISVEQYYAEKHITLRLRREKTRLADFFTDEDMAERLVAAECTSLVSQMSMVSNSNCIAAMSSRIAAMFADKFEVQILSTPFTSSAIQYRLTAHNRDLKNPANVWLRKKIKSYFL